MKKNFPTDFFKRDQNIALATYENQFAKLKEIMYDYAFLQEEILPLKDLDDTAWEHNNKVTRKYLNRNNNIEKGHADIVESILREQIINISNSLLTNVETSLAIAENEKLSLMFRIHLCKSVAYLAQKTEEGDEIALELCNKGTIYLFKNNGPCKTDEEYVDLALNLYDWIIDGHSDSRKLLLEPLRSACLVSEKYRPNLLEDYQRAYDDEKQKNSITTPNTM